MRFSNTAMSPSTQSLIQAVFAYELIKICITYPNLTVLIQSYHFQLLKRNTISKIKECHMSFGNRIRSIHVRPLFQFAISVPSLILYFGEGACEEDEV